MGLNDPTWSYGESTLINSHGRETDPDNAWGYGESSLVHEIVGPAIREFVAEHIDTHFVAESS